MAIATNTFLTFSAVGNREDLADTIFNISPTETPFIANAGTEKATAVLHEWQTDSLADAGANAALEADEFSAESVDVTSRESNRSQISTKEVIVSGTQSAVDTAGRNREIVYQLTKKGKELRRDMEKIVTGNQAPVTGNSTTARQLRPLVGWYTTNVSANGGSDGDASNARTDGTQRALTEDMLKDVIQSVWEEGGEGDTILTGPFNKRVISGFSGNATRFDKSEDKKLVTSIDIYVSDFGEHKIIADRFSRGRDVHVLTMDLWKIAYLRPMTTMDIAKTGDADKGKVLVEYTLTACNEAGSGLVADLTTS